MKTIVSLLFLVMTSISLHAQLKKGEWMIGGSAKFAHDKSEATPGGSVSETKATSYELLPGFGYFLADRVVAGLRLGFVGVNNKSDFRGTTLNFTSEMHSEIKTSGVGISPFFRYYFLPVGKKVNLLADLSYAYTAETEKTRLVVMQGSSQFPPQVTETSTSTKLNSSSISLSAGPAFFISEKVSFELTIGYTRKMDGKQDYVNNRIMFGTGFQVFLGKK